MIIQISRDYFVKLKRTGNRRARIQSAALEITGEGAGGLLVDFIRTGKKKQGEG